MNTFVCSKCGKSWPENYCPECGQTIERTAPELESGHGAPPVISRPPPLPLSRPPPPLPSPPPAPPPLLLPATKRPPRNRVRIAVALVVLGAVGFVGVRMVQYARYVVAHPTATDPGEAEFRAANKVIIAGNAGQVFGNSAAARDLARDYSKGLKILRDNLFTKGGHTALGPLEGDFLTYCQLNDDSCVFLVHVPELRQFTADAKKSLEDLAWIDAQSVLQASGKRPPKTVVVGVKGLMLYDAIFIGDYIADPKPDKDGIRTRGAGLMDMKLFYPYFAPPAAPTNK
jgi:hypothetical protein